MIIPDSGGRMDSTHFYCATSRHTSQHTSFIVETCVDLFSYRLTNIVRFSPLTAISQFSLCSHTKFISAVKNEEARIRFEERSYSKEVG